MSNANCQNEKGINELESGQILEVITTDKGSKSDMTAWVQTTGHELLEVKEENGEFSFLIKKG